MKALVTGVAGFIGSHLAGTLLERGATVTGLDCFTDYYPRPDQGSEPRCHRGARPGFRFVETSIQGADLDALLDDVTHVFHLAAQAGVRKSWGRDFQVYTTNNIDATQILLESVVGRPIEKLVYASSSSVYGDDAPIPMHEQALPRPLSPYGVTKLAAEQLCHLYAANHGVPATAVRYFTVYGPRQRPDMGFHRFLKAAITGAPITRLRRRGTDARFHVRRRRGGGHDSRRRAWRARARLQHRRRLARVDQPRARPDRRDQRRGPLDVRREPAQKGDMRDTYADTSLARADLGFSPTTSLKDGLTAEYHWLLTSPVLA